MNLKSWTSARAAEVLRRTAAGFQQLSAESRRLASGTRQLTVLMAVAMAGGCASLDAGPDVQRAAVEVESSVGIPAELLLRDAAIAAARTTELLTHGLTTDEAVQIALLNNPRGRVAMLSIGVSRADFVQSTLYSNPSLFLSLRLPDGGGRPNMEVNLAQSIAELWLVPARTRLAQRDLDRVILEAARVTSVVVLDVRRQCVVIAQAQAQVRIAEEGLEIASALVEMAQLRQKAGTGSEVDVNLARSAKLQADVSLRNSALALIDAKAELNRLLGLDTDPEGTTLVDEARLPISGVWRAAELQRIARSSRLDLRIMDQEVASAEALARLERVRFLRSVDVGFSIDLAERRSRGDRSWLAETFYDSLQSGALTPPNLTPRAPQGDETVAGPTLSIELPLWDQNQAQIARADRLLEQAQLRRDAALIDAAQDIYAGLAHLESASANARIFTDELVPTAGRNVKLAEEGYRIGRVPFLSLLEAQRAYISTRTGHIEALRDAALAEIQLERVTGRPAAAWNQASAAAFGTESRPRQDAQDAEVSP
ncbi:MAG: TolC family protein [Phycisphaerales bacterium]|nr:TolC family protein [Phycisphaerales bacterium]